MSESCLQNCMFAKQINQDPIFKLFGRVSIQPELAASRCVQPSMAMWRMQMSRFLRVLFAALFLLMIGGTGSAQNPKPISLPAELTINSSGCWRVDRPADGRITAEVIGPGTWGVCIGDQSCPTDCFDHWDRKGWTEPHTQTPYYYVKVLSRSPGVSVTLKIYATAAPAGSFNPLGTWSWRCCGGRNSGTFKVEQFRADGSFEGRFGDTADDGKTPLKGTVTGSRMQFSRMYPSLPNQSQTWSADLTSKNGVLRTVNGTWSGYGSGGGRFDFEAELTSQSKPNNWLELKAEYANDLRGEWQWTCCQGRHRGTFSISDFNAKGVFRGKFGTTPDDGNTPIEGQLSGREIVFTRSIDLSGKTQQQIWRGRLSSTGSMSGSWSGFGAVPGQTDFQAQRIR
jgi:hypothetical protein